MELELKRSYDTQDFVSVRDIASDLYTPFLVSHSKEVVERKLDLEVGQFLKTFHIQPAAKFKVENKKGKPSFLYDRQRVERSLAHLDEWLKKEAGNA